MTRLPFITRDDLDDDQQAVWDNVTLGRRGANREWTNAHGGLIGPFNAALHAPRIGRNVVQLGESIRFESGLDPRLLELAVCTVGAHWRSNFEWYAHSRLALAAGIDQSILDSLQHGETPAFDRDDEAAVHAFAHSLLNTGRVSDEVHAATAEHLDHRGVVELTQLIGYYCLVSFTLNAFEVELPDGVEPYWPV